MPFPPSAAVIVAAGRSERFSQRKQDKKEFRLLDDGKSVLYHAVLPFLGIPNMRCVVIAYSEDAADETGEALGDLIRITPVPITFAPGGETRQQSVRFALEKLKEMNTDARFVAIHDGARPYVTQDLIIQTLASATVYGAAAPAVPTRDSIRIIDGAGSIIQTPERSSAVNIQTPQIFSWPEILNAHRAVFNSGKDDAQDDTEVYIAAGMSVGTCEGDLKNIKITYPEDIK